MARATNKEAEAQRDAQELADGVGNFEPHAEVIPVDGIRTGEQKAHEKVDGLVRKYGVTAEEFEEPGDNG